MVEPGNLQTLACGVCKMAILPWLYELTLCWFSLVLKKKDFSCQITIFCKGDLVWSAFQAMVTLCTERVFREQGQPIDLFSKIEWEIWRVDSNGCFPELRYIGACVHSLCWRYISNMKLPNSCFWSLWCGHCTLDVWTTKVLLMPDIEKKVFSWQIILLL